MNMGNPQNVDSMGGSKLHVYLWQKISLSPHAEESTVRKAGLQIVD